jgi:transcription initiation factor TFIIE subunit alpha
VKRQQNALPAWHLKSTITGDLTALGVKESARTEGMNGQMPTSNDDILRGLGVIGGSKPDQPQVPRLEIREDVKPTVGNNEADCKLSIPYMTFLHVILIIPF